MKFLDRIPAAAVTPWSSGTKITVRHAIFLYWRSEASRLRGTSQDTYKKWLDTFEELCGDEYIEDLHLPYWQQIFDYLGQNFAISSCRVAKSVMKAVYLWCKRRGLVTHNPIPEVGVSGKRYGPERGLTPDELRALLRELPSHLKDLVEFIVLTGLRIGEATALILDDFNLGDTVVYRDCVPVPPNSFIVRRGWDARRRVYTPTKTVRGTRVVPLVKRTRQIIERRLEWRDLKPETPIFTSHRGKIIDRDGVVYDALKEAGARAGIPWVKWHTLRHTTASLVDLDVLDRQKLLGHAQVSTTAHYTMPSATRMRRGLEVVEQFLEEVHG